MDDAHDAAHSNVVSESKMLLNKWAIDPARPIFEMAWDSDSTHPITYTICD